LLLPSWSALHKPVQPKVLTDLSISFFIEIWPSEQVVGKVKAFVTYTSRFVLALSAAAVVDWQHGNRLTTDATAAVAKKFMTHGKINGRLSDDRDRPVED
jgi:hypothetical protein